MELAALLAQKEALERQIEQVRKEAVNQAFLEIDAILRANGITPQELVARYSGAARKNPRAGVKVPPSHIDPANPNNTWSGRGVKPKWLANYLAAGRDVSEFLIKR